MKHPLVTIGLILFKETKYLKQSLSSLLNQNYPNIEFLFRDQSPDGEVAEWIKREMPEIAKKVKLEKGENLMHSGGHNALIRKMKSEYYFCVSNDMLYPQSFVSELVNALEKRENQKYGSATCKLMHWNFQKAENGDLGASKTNMIDSCGLGITAAHHFYDLGQGQEDKGQFDEIKNVFGPSGALAVYRKSALEDIRYKEEFFDELLHYKNDIDLAYRLQWANHPCLLLPRLKVWHDRYAGNYQKSSNWTSKTLKNQKNKKRWVKESSFFGQRVTVLKNHDPKFSFSVKLKTLAFQMLYMAYAFLNPYLLRQQLKIRKIRTMIADKRKHQKKKVKPAAIEYYMKQTYGR
jgi:GT2 family glycosyltransferase